MYNKYIKKICDIENLAISSKTLAKLIKFSLIKKRIPNFVVEKMKNIVKKKKHWLKKKFKKISLVFIFNKR